jgi:DNA-binding transcriptional regulator YiaG
MTPDAFRSHLSRLGYSQAGFARLMDVDERTVRRWGTDETPIPKSVRMLLEEEPLKPA